MRVETRRSLSFTYYMLLHKPLCIYFCRGMVKQCRNSIFFFLTIPSCQLVMQPKLLVLLCKPEKRFRLIYTAISHFNHYLHIMNSVLFNCTHLQSPMFLRLHECWSCKLYKSRPEGLKCRRSCSHLGKISHVSGAQVQG